jgi:signal transduction histidine kinase
MPISSLWTRLIPSPAAPQEDLSPVQDFRCTQDTAQAVARSYREVLGALVHDLRNPLFALSGYAEMLATEEFGPLTASQSEILRRILQNTQELEQLLTTALSTTVDP